jgi:translation initiation factor 2-alpha kinase 4
LADAQRQQIAKERHTKARNRANSEVTAIQLTEDTQTTLFDQEIEVSNIRFSSVRLFHPRKGVKYYLMFPADLTGTEGFATIYSAEPVCDNVDATLPLELYSVTFSSQYYATSHGKHCCGLVISLFDIHNQGRKSLNKWNQKSRGSLAFAIRTF